MNYYCKNCNYKLEYYLLINNILYTKKEYKERIYKYYKKE